MGKVMKSAKKTQESHDPKEALAIIEECGLGATPENYQVFHAYIFDQKPALTKELGKLLCSKKIDQDACSILHAKYFGGTGLTDQTLAAGGKISAEMTAILRLLAAAERSAAEYGETLSGASDILDATGDSKTLKTMVDSLLKATAKMQKHTQDLENRLNTTTEEINDLRDNLEQVRAEAMTDALTGIANRKRFDECMLRMCEAAEREEQPLSLILCDIDNFKRFNDTWGHQTGDQIIRFVASCLQRNSAKHHLVARYGGEEFAIIMPGAEAMAAFDLADNVRAIVESKKLLRKSTNEDLGTVTISLGVASLAENDQVEDLIERADSALYGSKHAGRNKATINTDEQAGRSAA